MAEDKNRTPQNDNGFEDGFRILQGDQEYIAYREYSSIRIWPSEEAWHYARHTHSAIEIVLVQKGEVVIEMPTKTIHVREGQILFIPSDCPHSLSMAEDSSRLLFLFEPLMIMSMRDMSRLIPLWNQPIYLNENNVLREKITALMMKVNEIYNAHETMWNSMCYSYLMQIYALLGQYYIDRINPQSETATNSEIINSAIDYIKHNYMKKITLDDISDFVGFSRHYFSRIFKHYTGMSFLNYLCRCRLSAAEEQLINSERSIQMIAFDCGFTSVTTFNRIFREQKKCTPTYYRQVYSEKARNGHRCTSDNTDE